MAQAAENVVSIVENCPILGQAACIYKARDFNRGRIGLRSKTDNQKRREGLDSIFFNCLNAPFLTFSFSQLALLLYVYAMRNFGQFYHYSSRVVKKFDFVWNKHDEKS